ncbi:mediator complex subunit [Tilletia horrida]|nr:mediator complex subunit [Tilletia horrida]
MNANGGVHAHADEAQAGSARVGSSSAAERHQVNGIRGNHSPSKSGSGMNATLAAPASSLSQSVVIKSEKAQGKARQVDEVQKMLWASNGTGKQGMSHPPVLDDVPPEVLLSELLPQTENLVPLAAIVERMSNYGYEALQILSETLSSLPSEQRREKIFNTAVTVQRQLAKLVALALWSRLSGDLQKARDTVGLLCEQFAQAEDAVRELTGIRTMLPQSRLRNFDLMSAADVLRTGAYTRLPTIIKTSAVREKPMDDAAVDELVEELEDAIRLRLACHDVLPLQMSDYRIADGRAHFDVRDLFEASLTVDGPFPIGRWYLLTIRFDFRITGVGRDRFPRVPKKHFRDMLLEQVNSELAPPPPLPPEEDGQASGPELLKDANKGGQPPPLVKFFRHLEGRALQYQLDILAFQAADLEQSEWKGHLAVERDAQTQALRLNYWSQLRPKAPRIGRPPPPQPWRSGGSVVISIETVQRNQGSARSIAQILFGPEASKDAESLHRKRLGVKWHAEKSVKEGSHKQFAVDIHALDVKTLLLEVIRSHAIAILDHLRSRILGSTAVLGVSPDDCDVCAKREDDEQDALPHLRVKLCGAMTVSIGLHAVSGHIRVEEDVERVPDALNAGDAGNKQDAAIFAQSTERLNRDPTQVVEVLQSLRQYAICKDLEQKACFLGLEAVKRVPLQPSEYAKLGALPEAVLFLSLPQCPHWYLAPQFAAYPPRIALLSTTSYMMHGQVYMVLNTLQWLNRSKVLSALLDDNVRVDKNLADIGLDELAHLHWYGVAVVSYFRIEQQLQARGLPFSHTTSLPDLAMDRSQARTAQVSGPIAKVASRVPAIGIRSAEALGASSMLVKPNLFVRLSKWWDRNACSVQIIVRLSLRTVSRMAKIELAGIAGGGGGTIEYDAASRQLTFSTADIDNCVNWFLGEWDRFSKIGMLVKAVERARRWPGGQARGWKVVSYDFSQATFAYAQGRFATVTWSRSSPTHPAPEGFLLHVFADSSGQAKGEGSRAGQGLKEVVTNPHECIEAALEQNLNVGSSYSPGFWPSFLCLLHETLPVLEILQDACKDELVDVMAPSLELRSACWYRLNFQSRYGLDVRYLAGSRFIIADASRSLLGPSKTEAATGLNPLPKFHCSTREAVTSYYTLAQQFASTSTSSAYVPNGTNADEVRSRDASHQGASLSSPLLSTPPAVDLRRAVLCAADEAVVGPILSAVLASVREQLRQVEGPKAAVDQVADGGGPNTTGPTAS